MRARSGTYWQDFPTREPPYFRHSFLLSWLQSRAVTFNWDGGWQQWGERSGWLEMGAFDKDIEGKTQTVNRDVKSYSPQRRVLWYRWWDTDKGEKEDRQWMPGLAVNRPFGSFLTKLPFGCHSARSTMHHNSKKMKMEWKQALTPETLELLSGIGTKPLKMIVATVYEWQGGNETDSEEVTRRKTKREGKKKKKGKTEWESSCWTSQTALRGPCRQTKGVLTCNRWQPNCLCEAKTNKGQISYRNQCLQTNHCHFKTC